MLCTIPTQHNTLPRNCTTIDNIIKLYFYCLGNLQTIRCINKRLDDNRPAPTRAHTNKWTIDVLSLRPPPTLDFIAHRTTTIRTLQRQTLISYRAVELGEPSEYNPCLCAASQSLLNKRAPLPTGETTYIVINHSRQRFSYPFITFALELALVLLWLHFCSPTRALSLYNLHSRLCSTPTHT